MLQEFKILHFILYPCIGIKYLYIQSVSLYSNIHNGTLSSHTKLFKNIFLVQKLRDAIKVLNAFIRSIQSQLLLTCGCIKENSLRSVFCSQVLTCPVHYNYYYRKAEDLHGRNVFFILLWIVKGTVMMCAQYVINDVYIWRYVRITSPTVYTLHEVGALCHQRCMHFTSCPQ